MNSQPHHVTAGFDRDRDREIEEQRHRSLQQQNEMAQREREQSERQHREAYPSAAPHHNSAGSIPLHQPVASRISGAIHSPGGLLANHGGPAPSVPLGAPSGNAPGFGHSDSIRQGPHAVQNGPPPSQHQMFAPMPHNSVAQGNSINSSNGPPSVFGGPLQPDGNRAGHHMAFGGGAMPGNQPSAGNPASLPQGQQPILNDALSYLDQVKVQFHEQPDVYNRFLDIMKDFKSQTIDTPGVISRVSELFAGHPNLIQGFNTFLPPGYRIDCDLENNPGSIRVTTPSGSTIHSISGNRTQGEGAQGPAGHSQGFMNQRPGNWQQPIQHSIESPEAHFTVPVQNGPSLFNQGPAPNQPFESSPVHQRSVPAVQNAANAMPASRNAQTPTPSGPQGPVNGNSAAQQANMEKRGPVEFNHAISYVNKIKNRFQDKPEIYKQFLEILQTYQREQKPIQDVYAQVTTLFHTAPDLLEDFKQFLPESAAQTRSTGQRPLDDSAAISNLAQTPQPGQNARDGPKMPPVGNFAPPSSASKENKKRPRTDKQGTATSAPITEVPTSSVRGMPPAASGNKRAKLSHKPTIPDGPAIEPTLTPLMPEPLAPPSSSTSLQEEIAFFDKVRKHVGNKTAMNEFMKLCNMFCQDLLETGALVAKASHFIGGNPELMEWFKNFVNYAEKDEVVDNRPEPPPGKVSLSNCRGYGPSYRLLPKRERLRPCSGRDDLCNSVLNDDWASHPTWASEDSGFVAHRKNAFEEGLHRIEEERHDYDFNIEANQKVIQLLEPVAQQMLAMSPEERENFKMPPGLGGQSTSIYKRVLKKIYGAEKGIEVVNDLFGRPFAVVPIVLSRLKQKDEEWRFSQREWEKVWQSETERMYLKSLDHQGIQVKSNDKRNLSAKHLVDVIKTKHEEQRRARIAKSKPPRFQFAWSFTDEDVILDLLRLMIMYVMSSGQHGATEKERIVDFFETFVPRFFDLPEDKVQQRIGDIDRDSGEEEVEEATPAELTNGRSRRNGRKGDLLRGVLDPGRNGSRSRKEKEGSAASGSKETTPDVNSAEEEMVDAPNDSTPAEVSNDRWLPTVPGPTVVAGENPLLDAEGELKADAFFTRPWYNFFCNQTIFVFFSILQTLYKRLKAVKESEESVLIGIRREKAQKPAKQLGLTHDEVNYFEDLNPETFWPRTLDLIEDYINGEIDEGRYQDVLRRYYLKAGWPLYTISDLLKTLCRLSLVCNNSDSKEKTPDLIQQYFGNRQQEETSYQTEINSRKFAEKCIKDGEMFVICWFPAKSEATVRWLQKDETTFYMDEMELRDRWQYYISSYMRIEPTEGVNRSRLQKSVLSRNLPPPGIEDDESGPPKALSFSEGLVLRICLNSSKIVYEKGTSEFFIYNSMTGTLDESLRYKEHLKAVSEHREQKFREKMVMNNAWMKDMSQADVQKCKDDFQKWVNDGISPQSGVASEMDISA